MPSKSRVGDVAALGAVLALAGCDSPGHSPAVAAPDAAPALALPQRALYAAFDDGTIHVYDIANGHREAASFPTTGSVSDVRGVCASAATGVLYMAHERPEGGYVVAADMRTGRVLWNRAFQPSVDRLSCRHDGRQLFVPSNEAFTDDSLIVVDGATGDEVTRIHVTPRPHDCLDGLSGRTVYVETKSSPLVAVIDPNADAVVRQIGPFADIVGPYVVDSRETRMFANVFGVNGFQIADVTTGTVIGAGTIPGENAVAGELDQHGIALNPAETEVWVNDGVGGMAAVHVFDVTQAPPVPKADVALDAQSHWVTFSIAGDYAYVSGPKGGGVDAAVIDAKTYARVASIGPSEDMVEVDFDGEGGIARVGNQFGVGRASPPP